MRPWTYSINKLALYTIKIYNMLALFRFSSYRSCGWGVQVVDYSCLVGCSACTGSLRSLHGMKAGSENGMLNCR